MIIEHLFEDLESLLTSLCSDIATCLSHAITENDMATLLVSGGSTPKPLYKRLSTTTLAWPKIKVGLVDERWVEVGHEASNEGLVRRNLLINYAAHAQLISMKNQSASSFLGEKECNYQYSKLLQPFTLCLLGMGGDGHTASLFPNAHGLQKAINSEQNCAAIEALPSEITGAYIQRMTLTPWSIQQSKKIILLFTGSDKWEVYQQAKAKYSPEDVPVSIFLHDNQCDIDVYWAP